MPIVDKEIPNIDFIDQAPWITGRARKIAKKTFHQ